MTRWQWSLTVNMIFAWWNLFIIDKGTRMQTFQKISMTDIVHSTNLESLKLQHWVKKLLFGLNGLNLESILPEWSKKLFFRRISSKDAILSSVHSFWWDLQLVKTTWSVNNNNPHWQRYRSLDVQIIILWEQKKIIKENSRRTPCSLFSCVNL